MTLKYPVDKVLRDCPTQAGTVSQHLKLPTCLGRSLASYTTAIMLNEVTDMEMKRCDTTPCMCVCLMINITAQLNPETRI